MLEWGTLGKRGVWEEMPGPCGQGSEKFTPDRAHWGSFSVRRSKGYVTLKLHHAPREGNFKLCFERIHEDGVSWRFSNFSTFVPALGGSHPLTFHNRV